MTDFSQRRTTMVDTQVRPSDVTQFPIIEAMLTVPRESFVPTERREAAYAGEHIAIAPGRVVLDPRTQAKMLDAADIQPGDIVLDIGTGLGYSSAVVARMAEAVIAVEDSEDRANEAQVILAEHNVDNVVLHTGSLEDGAAEHGPYDVIIIQGGVENLPDSLLEQLKDGGRIACVMMTGALGDVQIGHKVNGMISWRSVFNAGAPVLDAFTRTREFAL